MIEINPKPENEQPEYAQAVRKELVKMLDECRLWPVPQPGEITARDMILNKLNQRLILETGRIEERKSGTILQAVKTGKMLEATVHVHSAFKD